jgi:hypothetical protein
MIQVAPVLRRDAALAIAFSMMLFLQPGLSQSVNVLTQHNDLTRDGANPNETILATSNVNESSFGKAFSLPVDGFIYAQPLYASGVAIPGQGTHNVLYIATAHDSVYAFDADSGTQYWQVSLGTPVPSWAIATENIQVEVGIISTPVIDPSSGTLYATAKTYENSVQIYRLHALDITTGAEKFGGPVEIAATVSGSASDGDNGIVTFAAKQQLQRPAVTLVNGIVYLAFGSHEDHPPYHGWVLGYDAKTLQQVQVFNDTPNSGQGAIWMGGQGLVADASNNVYLITANSTPNTGAGTGDLATGDYGESFLKLVPSGNSLTVGDYFKPNDYDYMNSEDIDLGSGGAFAIPGTSYIAGGGKFGRVFLVNTNNMGGLDVTANQMVQVFQGETNGLWGSPAFFNNTMYVWGANEPLHAFRFVAGLFNPSPSSQSAYSSPSGQTSGSVSVSSNGTTPGTAIVWATTPTGDPDSSTVGGDLYAFDATNVSNPIWSTTLNESRDGFGNYAKFVPPTIADGKVYIATDSKQVAVYGLLSGSVTLSNLTETYNSAPHAATATTTPSGLTVIFTYTGTSGTIYGPSATAPTAVGTYEVAANISDAKYTGTATGILTINKASASVTLSNLSQTYTGSPLSATATTVPNGAAVKITYTGKSGTTYGPSATPPTVVGSYTVAAAISDPNYSGGTASGTLVINKASAIVTLGGLAQIYTGLPLSATASTTPVGLTVTITYTGTGATTYGPSSTAPTLAGSYTVAAAVSDPNYAGSANGTLVISNSVLTQHNDLTRDGANPNETFLTTSNVNVNSFGKVFSLPVDGYVLAQPLYVPGVAVPGQGTHNILYVATEHDSVYAFDADSGTLYWQVSLGTPVPSPPAQQLAIQVEFGITGTPVIDPISGTLYVVPVTYVNGLKSYSLHALDITTGAEKFGGPVEISASVSGSAPDGNGGIVSFYHHGALQRAAVTLVNGVVYLAFSSFDEGSIPYHGWVLGYDASTLKQLQVFNVTPNGGHGAIWMGGQGLVADSSNNLYMITANSIPNTGPGTGDLAPGDYGESFLKLVPNGNSLTVGDYFKTNVFDRLNAHDEDLGSGGAFAIPGTSYIAGGGKDGLVYLVDTNNMGKLDMTADQMVQVFQGETRGLWGSPAFFNNTMYAWGVNEPLKAYKFAAGLFIPSPSSQSTYSSPTGETSGSVSVSSNGTTAGTAIVWATTPTGDPDGSAVGGNLYAFDATNVTKPIWSTALNESRDGFGNYAKFAAPTIANGKVYVPTNNTPGSIVVYGLLSGSVTLGNLTYTYNGAPHAATATTTPSGLTVIFTYTGTSGTTYGPSATAPTAVGTYEVAANISNATYTGTATGTLVINKASASVTLSNLSQAYTGSPLSATATTVPNGLSVTITYTGTSGTTYGPSATPPTAAGSYTVAAAISSLNYSGTASGTLVINKAAATVTLGGLSQVYTGLPLSATASTTPTGLTVTFTYTGKGTTTYGPSSTAPTLAGSYTVAAAVSDPNYAGSANGTLSISNSVLTQHNDLTRDGANPNETILTTSNVNVNSFGKVLSLQVDGYVLAQPLYAPGVAVPGQGTHNILYVATEHDSVYAFDADSGTLYWQVSLGKSVPSLPALYLPIPVEYGITSTPVIDPVSGTIYVVPMTLENSQHVYRLHALDITTGAEKFGGPVEIAASISGSAPDGSGGIVSFNANGELQRTAVTLVNGEVYLAFSGYDEGDIPYHGWVLGYDASALKQLQVFNDSPNGGGGGIWMGGQGFVADSSNNLYLITGNTVESSENLAGDYGENALKLTPSGNSLAVADYFKPWNYDWMNSIDNDLGAGGAFSIPGTSDIAFAGKQGVAYLLNTQKMGGFDPPYDGGVLQEWAVDGGQWGSPAFFNNTMYIWGVNNPLLAYQFNGSRFTTTPSSQSAYSTPAGQTNGAVSVSSNGTTPGTAIVWATAPTDDPNTSTVGGNLFAFDATNLGNLLWSTTQNPSRDGFGGFSKFVPPTIANGRVYVATNDSPGQIAVYGLLSGGVTLTNFTQTYTGSPLPVTATTVPSGLTVNITYTGVSGTTYGPSTVAPTAVGTYAVAANISDPKHTGTATGTLVINKATPTITWNAPAAITYGTALTNAHLAARSPVTGSYVYTPALGTVPAAGSQTLSVTFTPTDTADYTSATTTVSLTVGKATLTVTANNASRAYGAANPTFAGTISGFVSGDSQSAVSGAALLSSTATASSAVGSYPITASLGTLSATNYKFSFVGGMLTISKATLKVTASNASRAYGVANPAFTNTITGFVNGDTQSVVSGAGLLSSTATASSTVGPYPITASLGTLSAANYGFSFVNGTLTISKATLTVTANNASRAYGVANPAFTDTISGFINGDTQSVVSGAALLSTTATASSAVGSYPIAASLGTLSATNYGFSFVSGTLTISKATLTVTANNASRAYGVANPTFTDTISGFVNGDTQSVVSGAASLSTTATASSTVGPYPIAASLGTLSAANYGFSLVNGTLTISKATLTVTANNASRAYGVANPTFSDTISGFVNGDAQSVVSGATSLSTTATVSSTVGTYPIKASLGTLSAANYGFSFVNGTLIVNIATPAISWSVPAAITYGTALSATQLGASSTVAGTFAYTPALATVLKAGSQTLSVTFTPTDTTDYTTATATVPLTVSPATPAINWSAPAAIAYGTALGATHLNATSAVTGSFTYSPAAGTVLTAGPQKLTVTFTPTDTADYAATTSSVTLTVNQSTPTINWSAPAAITYGAALSGIQFNAISPVPGTFIYSPAAGTVLPAGPQKLSVTFNPTDTANYATATSSVTLTVNQSTPTINWSTPAAITYGTALSTTQLNATSPTAGTFIYSPAAGSVLATGSHQLSVTLSPTDATDFANATTAVTLTVNQQPQTISLSSSTQAYASGVMFGTASLGLNATSTSGLPVTFSLVSGPATLNGTSLTIAGAGTLVIAANQAGNANYLAASPVTESIIVNKALPVAAIAASVNPILVQNSVTLTATTASAVGTPTGTVTFMDGTTPLGTGTLASGVATLTTSSLSAGAHTITASYGGDTNFLPAASTPLAQLVQDFSFTISAPSVTVEPGGTAVFTFTTGPMNGATFPSAINLALSGLPAGASYSFSPATIAAGAGATAVTLTVDIPQTQASARSLTLHPGAQVAVNHRGGPGSGKAGSLAGRLAPFSLALVLLPFAGRLRRTGKRLGRILCVLLLLTAGIAAATGISACGGSSAGGYFAQPQQSYTVTVTGTSGALSHSTTVTLTVE